MVQRRILQDFWEIPVNRMNRSRNTTTRWQWKSIRMKSCAPLIGFAFLFRAREIQVLQRPTAARQNMGEEAKEKSREKLGKNETKETEKRFMVKKCIFMMFCHCFCFAAYAWLCTGICGKFQNYLVGQKLIWFGKSSSSIRFADLITKTYFLISICS